MNKLKTGDVLNCYTRDKFLSEAIGKTTQSKFSHTATVVILEGQPMIADSQKDGFNLKTVDNWLDEYGYIFEIRRPKYVDVKKYIVNVFDLSGVTPYDFKSLFVRQPLKLFLNWLNKFFKFKFKSWRKKGNEADRMYCSESIAFLHGVPNYFEMNPGDFYSWQIANEYELIK